MNLMVFLAALGGTGLVSGGLVAAINALANRGKVRADATVALSDAAIRQVNELQERTTVAEQRATNAEQRADQAVSKMARLNELVDLATAKLRSVMWTIHDPVAEHDPLGTIHRLRVMVPLTSGENGAGTHV